MLKYDLRIWINCIKRSTKFNSLRVPLEILILKYVASVIMDICRYRIKTTRIIKLHIQALNYAQKTRYLRKNRMAKGEFNPSSQNKRATISHLFENRSFFAIIIFGRFLRVTLIIICKSRIHAVTHSL